MFPMVFSDVVETGKLSHPFSLTIAFIIHFMTTDSQDISGEFVNPSLGLIEIKLRRVKSLQPSRQAPKIPAQITNEETPIQESKKFLGHCVKFVLSYGLANGLSVIGLESLKIHYQGKHTMSPT